MLTYFIVLYPFNFTSQLSPLEIFFATTSLHIPTYLQGSSSLLDTDRNSLAHCAATLSGSLNDVLIAQEPDAVRHCSTSVACMIAGSTRKTSFFVPSPETLPVFHEYRTGRSGM